jgi:acyl dehydratase
MPEPFYLDDMTVGQRFHAGPIEVTASDIKRFAAEFDPQPFHLDETAARQSLFGELVASGWHTAALTMRMLDESVTFAGGLIGTAGRLEWLRPVRPGDRLSLESEILEIARSKTRSDRGRIKMRLVTSNQRGEAVQILTAKVLAFARPAP